MFSAFFSLFCFVLFRLSSLFVLRLFGDLIQMVSIDFSQHFKLLLHFIAGEKKK
jgi:hypothetical protein